MKRKILHVVESFGGGVANAVFTYARAMPDVEHHLLRRIRKGEYVPSTGDSDLFATIRSLSTSNLGAIRDVQRHVRRLQPQVVHAHSSFAGAISRLAIRTTNEVSVCYTPHCYAFEREDLPTVTRAAIALTEKLLAYNTAVVAACSPREAELARSLRKTQRIVYVPNVSRVGGLGGTTAIPARSRPRVVTMGRVSQQKDPAFFADVASGVAERLDCDFLWIGDGDEKSVRMLRHRGVTVTGWVPQDKALTLLHPRDIYVHTAAWEAMPLAMLEAHNHGLPIIARVVPSMPWLAAKQGAKTPDGVAAMIAEVATDPIARARNIDTWKTTFDLNSPTHQRRALASCYGEVEAE